MSDKPAGPGKRHEDKEQLKKRSPEAERALTEANERRRTLDADLKNRPKEHGGRKGPEPTRYGDWERKGITSDF